MDNSDADPDTSGPRKQRSSEPASRLSGFPGHLSRSTTASAAATPEPSGAEPASDRLAAPTVQGAARARGRDMLWFATEAELGAEAEDVAYALRALIASDKTAELERANQREAVQILNVQVSADPDVTGGGHKTVSVRLRLCDDAG